MTLLNARKLTFVNILYLELFCFNLTQTCDVAFRPFDDVLTVGHSGGVASLVVPGSGEANIDSNEANPYQTNKQRRETDVRSLLDKLQPEMITLDPDLIGNVDKAHGSVIAKERKLAFEANNKVIQ